MSKEIDIDNNETYIGLDPAEPNYKGKDYTVEVVAKIDDKEHKLYSFNYNDKDGCIIIDDEGHIIVEPDKDIAKPTFSIQSTVSKEDEKEREEFNKWVEDLYSRVSRTKLRDKLTGKLKEEITKVRPLTEEELAIQEDFARIVKEWVERANNTSHNTSHNTDTKYTLE